MHESHSQGETKQSSEVEGGRDLGGRRGEEGNRDGDHMLAGEGVWEKSGVRTAIDGAIVG